MTESSREENIGIDLPVIPSFRFNFGGKPILRIPRLPPCWAVSCNRFWRAESNQGRGRPGLLINTHGDHPTPGCSFRAENRKPFYDAVRTVQVWTCRVLSASQYRRLVRLRTRNKLSVALELSQRVLLSRVESLFCHLLFLSPGRAGWFTLFISTISKSRIFFFYIFTT